MNYLWIEMLGLFCYLRFYITIQYMKQSLPQVMYTMY